MDHPTGLDRVIREQGRKGRWLAEQLGVSEASVSCWRKGKRMPDRDTRVRAALALGQRARDADRLFATHERLVTTEQESASEAAA